MLLIKLFHGCNRFGDQVQDLFIQIHLLLQNTLILAGLVLFDHAVQDRSHFLRKRIAVDGIRSLAFLFIRNSSVDMTARALRENPRRRTDDTLLSVNDQIVDTQRYASSFDRYLALRHCLSIVRILNELTGLGKSSKRRSFNASTSPFSCFGLLSRKLWKARSEANLGA